MARIKLNSVKQQLSDLQIQSENGIIQKPGLKDRLEQIRVDLLTMELLLFEQ